jgi:hypothetical protein
MAYASGVGPGNSTIFPAYDKDVLFRLPYASTKRAGLGDITLGLRWAPYNFYRDNTAPTVVMGVESVLPSGTVATASNDAVGQGLTRLRTYFTFSRRALTYLEPFFELHASMPFPSQDSLFQVNDPLGTQPFKTPAPSGGTRFGLTVIPWENVANDQRVELEGGMGLDYIGRGRDYTEVWEALANPTNPCRPDKDCANTSHWKSDNDPTTGQHTITNGIMDVQAYIRTQGWAALHYQPVRHFQISAKLNWLHETPHFISFGEYGKDLDGTQTVESQNKMKQNEYSPSFLPAIDTPGQRLRVLDANNLVFMIAVSGKL